VTGGPAAFQHNPFARRSAYLIIAGSLCLPCMFATTAAAVCLSIPIAETNSGRLLRPLKTGSKSRAIVR
jgi:hypothetical protein